MSRQIDSFALKDCRTACALGLCYISGWKYLRSSHQNVQAERLLSSAQTPDADADALLKRCVTWPEGNKRDDFNVIVFCLDLL
ncbi:hypothetical protein LSTR_LSTR017226 [Laodelphax striatellus]|uniref:Uncharacterized protein n=1 Tax=Laodelphax striatellus TaxID=195883 RepID=A0A482XQP1_LAOST|nr:hypothetical protein LSTR_LSTR017226 [Laodelphax striatellus]